MEKLINKIQWASNVHKKGREEVRKIGQATIVVCMYLEAEGFGMLANKKNLEKIDLNYSVVCPNGTIIDESYLSTNYKSQKKLQELSDIEKANMYFSNFIQNINLIIN